MTPASLVEYVMVRRRSGETLESIAEDFGVTFMAVYFWCEGKRKPSRIACRIGELLVREQVSRGLWRDHPELDLSEQPKHVSRYLGGIRGPQRNPWRRRVTNSSE